MQLTGLFGNTQNMQTGEEDYFKEAPIGNQVRPETEEDLAQVQMIVQQAEKESAMSNALSALIQQNDQQSATRNGMAATRINTLAAEGAYGKNSVKAEVGSDGRVTITGSGAKIGQGIFQAQGEKPRMLDTIDKRLNELYALPISVERANALTSLQADFAVESVNLKNQILETNKSFENIPGIQQAIAKERAILPYGQVSSPYLVQLQAQEMQALTRAEKRTEDAMANNPDYVNLQTKISAGIQTSNTLGKVLTAQEQKDEARRLKVENVFGKAGPVAVDRAAKIGLLDTTDAKGNVTKATTEQISDYIIGLKPDSAERKALTAPTEEVVKDLALGENNPVARKMLLLQAESIGGETGKVTAQNQLVGFDNLKNNKADPTMKFAAAKVLGKDSREYALFNAPSALEMKAEDRKLLPEIQYRVAKEAFAIKELAGFQNNVKGWATGSDMAEAIKAVEATGQPANFENVAKAFIGNGTIQQRNAKAEQLKGIVQLKASDASARMMFSTLPVKELVDSIGGYVLKEEDPIDRFLHSDFVTGTVGVANTLAGASIPGRVMQAGSFTVEGIAKLFQSEKDSPEAQEILRKLNEGK